MLTLYDHEPNVAVPRFLLRYADNPQEHAEVIARKQRGGHKAIGAMEEHLSSSGFFVADRYTIADIALYAYTHAADEAGIDLTAYPPVSAWLDRVARQPGHMPIEA